MMVATTLLAKKAVEVVLEFHPLLPYTTASCCAQCPHVQFHLQLLPACIASFQFVSENAIARLLASLPSNDCSQYVLDFE